MKRAFGKQSRLLVITLTRLGQPDSFATAPFPGVNRGAKVSARPPPIAVPPMAHSENSWPPKGGRGSPRGETVDLVA